MIARRCTIGTAGEPRVVTRSALRLPVFALLLPVIFVIVGALRPRARPRPELAHQPRSLEYLAAECCLPRAQRIRRLVGVERAAVELPARAAVASEC